MGKCDELVDWLSAVVKAGDRVSPDLGDEVISALEGQNALISDLVEALDAATIHMEVALGGRINSNQINDKYVIGVMRRDIENARAALAKARETR